MTDATPDLWPTFEPGVSPLLGDEDDLSLWAAVVRVVCADARTLCRAGGVPVLTRLGRCSHWMRPHQTRWTADGGFAWPAGYDGPRFGRAGLPEFDWSRSWVWNPAADAWVSAEDVPTVGQLVFRVAVPARSRRHPQAAVHTVWQPGSPTRPKTPLVQFDGFRHRDGVWTPTAYRATPGDGVYETAGDPDHPPD